MSHVNVAMRVRPTGQNIGEYITLVPPGTMVINKPEGNDMYQFSYTYAAQDVQNEEIYEQIGKPVVESVLDGYNGTVLAYGQTGSGAGEDLGLRVCWWCTPAAFVLPKPRCWGPRRTCRST
jgi:hypothetical protein